MNYGKLAFASGILGLALMASPFVNTARGGLASGPQIGVIDLDKTLAETGAGKRSSAAFAKTLETKQAELTKQSKEFQKVKSEFEKQRDVLKADVRAKKEEELEAKYVELQQLYLKLEREIEGLDLVTVAGDVSDQLVVDQILDAADGHVDALANVAGIMDGFLPPAEIDDATWQRVMDVNVTAIMRLTRAALPSMIAAGHGSIVNVTSEAGLRGSAAGTAYTTSKHAVIGFTKSTSFFYAPNGIRCNAVAPGAVATNIEAPFRSQFAGERLGPYLQVNVPAVASSEELAAAITWLLSDDSTNITGAILPSDGGWAAI